MFSRRGAKSQSTVFLPKAWKFGCRARRASEAVVNYCKRAATTRNAKIPSLHNQHA